MILGKDNRKKWSALDVLIMQAYQVLQDERCQHCGYPVWICHNPDARLIARKKVDKCWIDEEVDTWREAMKDDDDVKYVRPEIYARDKTPLHKFRRSYHDSLAAEAAEEEGV